MTKPRYILKSGQINFESTANPNAYQCVVIKNGEIHNLTDDTRQMLIDALQKPNNPQRAETPNIEDMF